jgi:hypothetical protein
LKNEIEEWKNVFSEKDAELRAIYHKLFNDKNGIDKKIDFNEEVKNI